MKSNYSLSHQVIASRNRQVSSLLGPKPLVQRTIQDLCNDTLLPVVPLLSGSASFMFFSSPVFQVSTHLGQGTTMP